MMSLGVSDGRLTRLADWAGRCGVRCGCAGTEASANVTGRACGIGTIAGDGAAATTETAGGRLTCGFRGALGADVAATSSSSSLGLEPNSLARKLPPGLS